MKKIIKYMIFTLLVGVVFSVGINVYAISNVETIGRCAEYNDKCLVYNYNINKKGETKDFGTEIGIVHFKDTGISDENKQFIVSYNSCTNCAAGALFNSTQYDVAIQVNSSTAKIPLAICGVPMNGSNYLNENLTDYNARDYIYFNETEIKTAIDNGKCSEEYVLYNNNSVNYTCNNKTALTSFTATKDVNNLNIITSSYSSGLICQVSIKKDDFSKVYNHNNPLNGCNSSNYQVSCHYVASNRYDCTLYSCGSSIVEETDTSKTCTLVNMNNSSEEIKFSYSYKFNGIDNDQTIIKNGVIVTDPIPFGGDISETYISAKSCPMYIYRVVDNSSSTGYKWRILESEEVRKSFEKNNSGIIMVEKYKWGTSENPIEPDNDVDSNNSDTNSGSIFDTDKYGCPKALRPIIYFIKKLVFNTLQIFVPIILILMGTIDFVKASISVDDKVSKEVISKFIKRVLAAVLMFFIVTIVSIVMNMFASTDVGKQDGWQACWNNID